MSLLIKNWSEADWKELLKWAKIGANNAMIGEFAEVEEIQPHGRLIDADKIGLTDFEIILCQKGNPFKNALEMLLEKIEDAPTVIEAEEGE